MARTTPSLTRSPAHQDAVDPFAMQLALSTVHARLVPMRRGEHGYELDPSTADWFELPAGRGFAGYGLGRALRMLLDVLRGLTALHDTFDATGETFAHGDVALPQLRIDPDGVCRLVPLTARHSLSRSSPPAREALGHLAPERLLGELVDVRSDVFSAGALLWEALAGRRLFEDSTSEAIIDRLMGEKLQMPQLPPELAWAIPLKVVAARALSVDPYQRFADCAELATAIAIVARERVASHAEIATFFGAPQPSGERRTQTSVHPGPDESVLSALFIPSSGPRTPVNESANAGPLPSEHPVPTRSSTFRAVTVPSSGRTSTLAPLGPARSLTPPPSGRATPAPTSSGALRNGPHLSPFSALLSAESRPELPPQSRPPASEPASGRRSSTLRTFGTPEAALAPSADLAPESAPPSAPRPPPMPPWAPVPNVPVQLLSPSLPELPAAVPPPPVPATIEPTLEEVSFRPRRGRRIAGIALLIALAAATALAFSRAKNHTDSAAENQATVPTGVAAVPALTPASATRRAGVPESIVVPTDNAATPIDATPSTPLPRAPAVKAPARAGSRAKDYGI